MNWAYRGFQVNINELIHASPLFFEIEDKEITFIMKQCKIQEFLKNTSIFQEGDQAEQIYLILSGKILVQKNIQNESIRVDELETGDIFGTAVFSEEKLRDHSAVALCDSYVLELDYVALEALYAKKPELFGVLMLNITRLLAKRLFKANSAMFKIAELAQNVVAPTIESIEEKIEKPLVYVIEDDSDARHLLERYLEDDFVIKSFPNPIEVMDAVASGKIPDLFVTDFMMPEMSGIEFTEFLREEKINKPVIFVSGVNQYEMAQGALNLGVYSLITKPFKREDLLFNLNRALRERALLDFNNLLLDRYVGLFTSLSRILRSLDSQNFVSNLKQLVEVTQVEYKTITERKKWLKLP